MDKLTAEQALTLFHVASWAKKNGGLLPRPTELARLIKRDEAEALARLAELSQLGFFICQRGLATFHTKAAAMYPEEAAVIIVTSDLCGECRRSWVTKEEIESAVSLRYRRAREWRIESLIETAVDMDYLTAGGNGTYECNEKIGQHWQYLKYLLLPLSHRRKP